MANSSLNKWALYIVAATIVLTSQTRSAHSAPLQDDFRLNGSSIADRDSSPSIVVEPGDYILSDEQFQLLECLGMETRDSVALNPDNYVSENVGLDEIIRMLNDHPQTIEGFLTGRENQSVDLRDALIQRSNSQTEQSIDSRATVEDNNLECAICTEPLDVSTRLLTLWCSHTFHKNCIRRWYDMGSHRPSCPICRVRIVEKDFEPRGRRAGLRPT